MKHKEGQAAPLYWIVFMAIIFAVLIFATYLSPVIEFMGSFSRNVTANLPLNGSISTTTNIANTAFVVVPLIIVVGLLIAIIMSATKKEFDTEEGYYG